MQSTVPVYPTTFILPEQTDHPIVETRENEQPTPSWHGLMTLSIVPYDPLRERREMTV